MISISEFNKIKQPGTKRCSSCGEIKPIEEFVKDGRPPDGYDSRCKVCHRERKKEYARRPEVRERHRKYLQNHRKQYKNVYHHKEAAGEFIYIFKWYNYCKIGRAMRPRSRVRVINASLPFPGEIICIIPTNNMVYAESYLHISYAHLRRGGEWFELSNSDIDSLCAVKFIEVDNGQVKLLTD